MTTNTSSSAEDPVSLFELISWFRRHWLLVASILTACIGIALAAALFAPKRYAATIVVSPVSANSAEGGLQGASSMSAQLGGLSSLIGLGGALNDKRAEALAVLQSDALTKRYLEQNDLLPILFSDDWDASKSTWRTSGPDTPSLWQANEMFKKKIREISQDGKTGIVTLRIIWRDPQLAAAWANGLVALANEYLREDAIATSSRNITYLREQAGRTDLVGMKQAAFNLLEREMNREMLARGNQEYSFKTIDPAVAPEKPSSPKPKLWVAIAAAIGVILSIIVGLIAVSWPSRQ